MQAINNTISLSEQLAQYTKTDNSAISFQIDSNNVYVLYHDVTSHLSNDTTSRLSKFELLHLDDPKSPIKLNKLCELKYDKTPDNRLKKMIQSFVITDQYIDLEEDDLNKKTQKVVVLDKKTNKKIFECDVGRDLSGNNIQNKLHILHEFVLRFDAKNKKLINIKDIDKMQLEYLQRNLQNSKEDYNKQENTNINTGESKVSLKETEKNNKKGL